VKISVSIAPFVAAALLVGCASDVRFSDLFDESAAAEGHRGPRQFSGSCGRHPRPRITPRQNSAQSRSKTPGAPSPKCRRKLRLRRKAPAPVKPAGGKKPTAATKPRKKLPRVIAVATERDAKTDPKAARAVMLWDTSAQQIVGNKVYDIESEPPRGADVRFETQAASYLGASL
jgi:hypothetical protein